MAKLRVGVVFGGRSGEHEVSLVSAAAVLAALDPKRYEVIPIGITREGRWRLGRSGMLPPTVLAQGTALRLQPQPPAADTPALRTVDSAPPALRAADEHAPRLDVILPILHGPFGEDGSVQGFFELAGVPYAGSGVLGSAVAMDKDVMKRLFREAGLPVGPYCRVLRTEWDRHPQAGVRTIERELRYPLFVKPANLGSSVGISKVHNRGELAPAMALASGYDEKVVVEQGIEGRELECAVLGNDPPLASALGEIIAGREFYDYDAKYSDAGSRTLVPAPVSARVAERVRRLAIRAFQATECRDLARVDFFLEQGTGKVWLNEINSLPGFTPISMFPQLWAASGVGFSELLDRLIGFALERSRRPAADAASMVK